MKRESSGSVLGGIRQIAQGLLFVSEDITAEVMRKFVGAPKVRAVPFVDRLSDHELEIFRRMGQRQKTRIIADALHISIKTVQTHCMHIKEKLGIENATMLVREAVRWVEGECRALVP